MFIRNRIIIVMFSFLGLFAVLTAAVGFHQVVKGPQLAEQAASMRSKQIGLKEFPRGEILDRNLIPLTGYHKSYAVYFFINRETIKPQNIQEAAGLLAAILDKVSRQEVIDKIHKGSQAGTSFVKIAHDLTTAEIEEISRLTQPGIVVAPISKRYDAQGFAAHILGYLSNDGFKGMAGVEKSYNDILQKNSNEQELVTVLDARGMAIKGLMFKIRQSQESERGAIVLTIDRRIQEIVENALEPAMTTGAVVVLDVKSREILAMASRPTFNQYDINSALLDKKGSPLINRALNSYHPGSLFKILVAAAALEEKKVKMDEEYYCSGKFIINDQVTIKCWQEEGHKDLNFAQAFANSCNSAFIELGIKLGRETVLAYANKMRVLDDTIIGLPDYNANSFIDINPGRAAMGNASIGQQGIMLTPLQAASLIATIADDGYYKKPSLVKYSVDREGNRNIYPAGKTEKVLKTETARSVQKLMEKCISEGTGRSAAMKETMVAGKTATSQTGIVKDDGSESLNAWFGGYFPAGNPRWAIVVLVEEGNSGAAQAAPVFKEIAGKILPLYTADTISEF